MSVPSQDDGSIHHEDALLRRVPDRPRMVTDDGRGGLRPTSAALELRPHEKGCSVDVQVRLADPARPESSLDGSSQAWGLATFTAGEARKDGHHRVLGDPTEDSAAHALVVPTAVSRAAQKRNFSKLARQMRWVRMPTASG